MIQTKNRELLTNAKFREKLRLPQYNLEGNFTTIANLCKLLLKGPPVGLETIHADLIYRQLELVIFIILIMFFAGGLPFRMTEVLGLQFYLTSITNIFILKS